MNTKNDVQKVVSAAAKKLAAKAGFSIAATAISRAAFSTGAIPAVASMAALYLIDTAVSHLLDD